MSNVMKIMNFSDYAAILFKTIVIKLNWDVMIYFVSKYDKLWKIYVVNSIFYYS